MFFQVSNFWFFHLFSLLSLFPSLEIYLLFFTQAFFYNIICYNFLLDAFFGQSCSALIFFGSKRFLEKIVHSFICVSKYFLYVILQSPIFLHNILF